MLQHVNGIARSSAVYSFNEGYLKHNGELGANKTGFLCVYKNDLAIPGYIQSILDFCLENPMVHEKLGLSFKEIWNMDVWLFSTIRKAIRKYRPKEDAALQQIQKELSNS